MFLQYIILKFQDGFSNKISHIRTCSNNLMRRSYYLTIYRPNKGISTSPHWFK